MQCKVIQYLALVATGDDQSLEHQYISNELHPAVSEALNIPSSLQSQMANSVIIYSLTADPMEKGRS